jgi:hypothetical protein
VALYFAEFATLVAGIFGAIPPVLIKNRRQVMHFPELTAPSGLLLLAADANAHISR